jgi:Pectate lyase superfamily protein
VSGASQSGSARRRRARRDERGRLIAALVVVLAATSTAALAALTGCGSGATDLQASSSSPAASVAPSSSGEPSPSASPKPKPTQKAVSVKSFGAKGDGSTDDTAAIRSALSATAGRGVAVTFPPGTYLVVSLGVPDGSTLFGQGSGTSWIKGRLEIGGRSHLADLQLGDDGAALRFANGAAHTLFERVSFVGGGGMDSGEDQGVIRFSGGRSASSIAFVDCVIGANSADGNGVSMVSNGWSGATYHDISWRRCRFASSPRMALEVIQRFDGAHAITDGYRRIDFSDCEFEPSGSEILSYDAVGDAGYSTISGCTFKGAGWNRAYPYGQGIEFNGATAMRFVGNTVYRCRGAMINHSGRDGATTATVIAHNLFDGTVTHITSVPTRQTQTIYFNAVSGAHVHDNVIRTDVGGELAYIDSSSADLFARNTWTDERPAGRAYACLVLTDASRAITFDGEQFTTAATGAAAYVQKGTTGTLFKDCVFALAAGATPVQSDPGLTVGMSGSRTD